MTKRISYIGPSFSIVERKAKCNCLSVQFYISLFSTDLLVKLITSCNSFPENIWKWPRTKDTLIYCLIYIATASLKFRKTLFTKTRERFDSKRVNKMSLLWKTEAINNGRVRNRERRSLSIREIRILWRKNVDLRSVLHSIPEERVRL